MTESSARAIVSALKKAGIEVIASLPDSQFAELESTLSDESNFRHVLIANEADGLAICGGAWLGGTKAAIFMENSGLLLSGYVLTRLHIAFGIPNLLLVTYRGDLGDGNWWASPGGQVTEPFLRSLGLQYVVVRSSEEIAGAIERADKSAMASLRPTVVLFGMGSL
ncbi:MAG: sulfopyruvate decarboxylase [Deltaproteobacteria bacterium]|nr:sulfopyruvate decarboxylase [Deltaproteobacteria bacterium]